MLLFVPQNIGFHAIRPNQYIGKHAIEFANELYNPEPYNPTYCMHKGSYLVKPDMIVASNGYILTI